MVKAKFTVKIHRCRLKLLTVLTLGATEWTLAETLFFKAYAVILALWLALDSGR